MSVVELYSLEKKFEEKRDQYVSLMNSINYSCLGKEKTSVECLRAARLNAQMQTYLIQMSNLMIQVPKTEKNVDTQQLNLLRIADSLETDMKELVTNEAISNDTGIQKNMYESQAFLYGFVSIIITGFIIYQYKKI
jgi:hypothetical protein